MKDHCEVCEHRSYLFDDLDPVEWSLLNNGRKEVAYKKGSIIKIEGKNIEIADLQRLVRISEFG